ncbi:MAG: hypothetical protein L6R39_002776 [Caloplaca ligustica]|nr:MAG: hypothetical protein L6R39_002776 [Caloplaca ligustica]
MRYATLAVLALAAPIWTQAGPVQVDPLSGPLVARAPAAGDGDSCDTTEKCKNDGQKYWDALQAKLKDDNAQDVTKYDDTLDADYLDAVTRDQSPDAVSWEHLFKEELHLDFSRHFAVHSVAAKNGARDAFENEYNTNQGVMIGMWNYKEHDTKQTMPFSEVVYQCYRKECDNEKELKKFQFAGVMNVANPEFTSVQDDLYSKNNRRKLFNKFEKWTYEDNKDAFLALLGTPKLSFVLRMLTDHSVKFGKRVPTEVWTNIRTRAVYVKIDEYKG